MAWKYAIRLIKHRKKFYILAVLNLALGLLGLSILQNFKSSIEATVDSRISDLLGSHMSISSRTLPDSNEIKNIESQLPTFEKKVVKSFYTMVKGPKGLRLVHVIAQEPGFPFFGGLILENNQQYPQETGPLSSNESYVYPELQTQLGLSKGESFLVGEQEFVVSDFIENDLSQSFSSFSLAPKIYIDLSTVEGTELLQKGSTLFYRYHYKFEKPLSSDQAEAVKKSILSPGLRLSTPDQNGDQVSRLLTYLNDFLGLASLMAFTLVCIGLHYYYKSQESHWRSDVAVLKFLGIKKSGAFLSFFAFMVLLGISGATASHVISSILSPLIQGLAQHYLDTDFNLQSSWQNILYVTLVAVVGNILLSLPIIIPLLKTKTSSVFSEHSNKLNFSKSTVLYIPFIIFMGIVAIWLSKSWLTGSLFIGCVLILMLISFLFANIALKLCRIFADAMGGSFKISIRYLSSYKISTLTIVSSLALSIGLMSFIPGLRSVILNEISGADMNDRPSFFLFDIQDDQKDALTQFIDEYGGFRVISPMIRSRITEVNGEKYTRSNKEVFSRQDEVRQRFRNRGVNLSFAEKMAPGDQLLQGEWFSKRYNWDTDEIAEMSLEKRYAKRLGLEFGDIVEFDVLGMPVKAKITSIRSVKWTTFDPNFFVVLQPGVLEEAPKTWLASAKMMDDSTKAIFQEAMFEKFPNISLVDVEKITLQVMKVIQQMSTALISMSVLSLLVAFIVLGTLVYHKVLSRRNDLGLLKILGMNNQRIQKIIVYECLGITILATIIGLISGIGLVYLFATVLFETPFIYFQPEILITPLISLIIAPALGYFIIRTLQKSPEFHRQVF